MPGPLKPLLRRLLARAGYAAIDTRKHYAADGLFTVHNDAFRRDPRFLAAYARGVQASGGHDPHIEWRAHVALWAARTALRVPGDFVECGVNAGFLSSAILHDLDWNAAGRRFYLIDTFAGPDISQYAAEEIAAGRAAAAADARARGAYVTGLDRVRANFAEWPNAVVTPGRVPDVLATLPRDPVAFLHLDLNCAEPERAALEYFWPALTPGAVVLMDDYAFHGYAHHHRVLGAAAAHFGTSILSLPTGQGLLIR